MSVTLAQASTIVDAALKDATAALKINQNAPLFNNRALIFQAKKDYDKALQDYAEWRRIPSQPCSQSGSGFVN